MTMKTVLKGHLKPFVSLLWTVSQLSNILFLKLKKKRKEKLMTALPRSIVARFFSSDKMMKPILSVLGHWKNLAVTTTPQNVVTRSVIVPIFYSTRYIS